MIVNEMYAGEKVATHGGSALRRSGVFHPGIRSCRQEFGNDVAVVSIFSPETSRQKPLLSVITAAMSIALRRSEVLTLRQATKYDRMWLIIKGPTKAVPGGEHSAAVERYGGVDASNRPI